ncbi:MAG: cytochrome c oxidase subunit II transmembrane domain-containing protein [Crocinitomicaceae bacterium]|nr:cytochrome c oxidase subunit II transmembrane domain-containing protein [Crocinitomicaceae bacterium]
MEKIIILIVLITGVIAIAQLVRVYELTYKLKNKGEHEIPDRDNNLNAKLMLGFMMFQFLGFIYLMLKYGWTGRGEAASLQGAETDWLLNVNFIIIIAVFFLTNFLLFFFSYKYVRKPGVKATYYSHNNKLELIWTIVPAVVLAVIIILGLKSWTDLTSGPSKDSEKVELFAYQFAWIARYGGEDNTLGKFDYKLTTGNNELALMTSSTIDSSVNEMGKSIANVEEKLKRVNFEYLTSEYRNLLATSDYKSDVEKLVASISASDFNLVDAEDKLKHVYAEHIGAHGHIDVKLNEPNAETQSIIGDLEQELSTKERLYRSLVQMKQNHNPDVDKFALNDIVQKDTLYLCKGREYEFSFRAKDVIHSAYFPHFRAQMNVVPGMPTRFKFTPTITTAEMRVKKEDSKFNYVLMCNKICGGAHYKMKMIVVVYPEAEYNAWIDTKKSATFKDQYFPKEEAEEVSK